MTIGYGGLQELPFRVKWAKIHQSSHNHGGKFHAWTPLGVLCGKGQAGKPTRFHRDTKPIRSCKDCAKAANR